MNRKIYQLNPKEQKKLGNVRDNSLSFVLSVIKDNYPGLVVAIVDSFERAIKIERELKFFTKHLNLEILHFPDWEILPYDQFSPHQDIISERIKTLVKLPHIKNGVLILPLATVLHRLSPKDFIQKNSIVLETNSKINLKLLSEQFIENGYYHTTQVQEHGEYCIRGSILDLFPMGADVPYRIDFFDDEIDSIRSFDPESQRTIEKVPSIKLLTAKEYSLTNEAVSTFRTNWREEFSGDPTNCPMYLDVSEKNIVQGLEYYIPLFFKHTSTIFDYLPKNTFIVKINDLSAAANEFQRQIKYRYEQYSGDLKRPILKPNKLFLAVDEFFNGLNTYQGINLSSDIIEEKSGQTNISFKRIDHNIGFTVKAHNPYQNLEIFLNTVKPRCLFCVESKGRKDILLNQLASINIKPSKVHNWQEFLDSTADYAITLAPLEQSLWFEKQNIILLPEAELTGFKVMQGRRRKLREVSQDLAVQNLAELKIGDPVVHIDHGVGRYLGLTVLQVGGSKAEFVSLNYANDNKLYVPVTSLQLISRYSGVDLEHAPLHALGNERWSREKQKAAKKAHDVAAELLEIYAKREAKHGYAFAPPNNDYQAFAESFLFEETIDQLDTINAVIDDLTSERPMDRVVCGDVGFGKTEVALRAAFLAVQNNKQVAMLVPTTLLAEQHYTTFTDRFADFPVNIEVLSRFKSKKELEQINNKLQAGTCDIVIGTHKLLQPDVKFKNLGLIIIDEEHRFGVKQKERFKALRSEIDVLTLTATPIPRTLNMAMAKIRDLSIISTPPAKRLAVKTFVREYNPQLIGEAIEREIRRGGQVYYLHNDVATIENTANTLRELVPNARIAVAHGKITERDLERVMEEFYHRKFNVLVCTTIIETGIDIPTANTIILDRADKLGLAQLHQLRGRVGRSHHQAYAFCLIPDWKSISRDAQKRLEAIELLDTLGAGFNLATHDLEIRGAGELLGDDQSGHMQTVGFSMYMELINHAVQSLRNNQQPDFTFSFENLIDIDLQVAAIIPASYVPDVHTRLVLYKRIANAKSWDEVDNLHAEIVDRFGSLPEEGKNLLKITKFKLQGIELGVKSIKLGKNGGKIEFINKPNVDPLVILELVRKDFLCYKFLGSTTLGIKMELADINQRFKFLENLLAHLKTGKLKI
jgi:transcription-repair coupling factor (superfamily II helicase)